MSQFFTPIQAPLSSQAPFQEYQLQKYSKDPFQIFNPCVESLGDHRRKLIQWLKSMSISARIQKLSYTNKQFATLLIKMFQQIHERTNYNLKIYQFAISFHPYEGYILHGPRINNHVDQNIYAAQKKLMHEIIISNCFTRFDSVTISQAMAADIDKLFDLFDLIQNGISQDLNSTNYKFYEHPDSHLIFFNKQYSGASKSLCSWFVEVIKKSLSLKYFQETSAPSESLIGCSTTVIEAIQQKPKKIRKTWKNFNEQTRKKIINQIVSMDINFLVNQYRQNIRIADSSFPQIKVSHPLDVDNFIKRIESQGQRIFEILCYTSLLNSLQSLAIYKYQLLIQLEQIIERQDRKINMRKKCKKQQLQKIPQNLETNKNRTHNSHNNQIIKDETAVKNKQSEKQLQEKCVKINLPNSSFKKTLLSNKNKKLSNKQLKSISSQKQDYQKSQATNDVSNDDLQSAQPVINLDDQTKYEAQFNKIYTQITQKSNSSNKLKKLAINRITHILEAYGLSYKIFGSYQYGLSLPSSDIDFCIDPNIVHYFYGSFCSYRKKINMALDFLKGLFSQQIWAINLNLITTAAVPLLTFDVDLSIVITEPKNGIFNSVKPLQNIKQSTISIDVTIQPFSNMIEQVPIHLGYESTTLIKDWLEQYQKLSGLILIFKYLLAKSSLNKAFTGGVSSFTLIVWIVGFLQHQNKNSQLSIKELVIKFCQLFSIEQQKTCIIDVRSEHPVIFLSKQNINKFSSKLVVVSPINNKNLTDNCFKFEQIKILLKNIREVVGNSYQKGHKQYKKNLRNFFFQ